MPDWALDLRDELEREFELRYTALVRWVENWTLNDQIFWASMATMIVIGVVVILNMTKGTRLGALRHVASTCALICVTVYIFGMIVNVQAGGMSHVFGR